MTQPIPQPGPEHPSPAAAPTSTPGSHTGVTAFRLVLYTGIVLGFTASLPAVARGRGLAAFTDGGIVEMAELALLIALTVVHAFAAWRVPAFRAVFTIMASLTAFAAFREYDHALDTMVPIFGWKIGYLAPVAAAVFVLRRPDATGAQIAAFLGTRGFVMHWAGVIIAIPIGQLVGHGELLELLKGDDYNHHYKHAIEEILESAGYLVLATAACESIIELRNRRP